MKKIKLICILLLLCGCAPKITIEEDAKLHIAVENEAYGNAIIELWDETYPENSNAISIAVLEENEILTSVLNDEEIPYDVFLIHDEDIATALDHILEIPSRLEKGFEVDINEEFSSLINDVKNCYYPLLAEGMLYAVNTKKVKNENIELSAFDNFETLFPYANKNPLYYLDNGVINFPLLSSVTTYLPNSKTHEVNFSDEGFETSLLNFKTIFNSLDLKDDPSKFDNWFINQEYLSGLIGSWMQASESEEYNQIVLRYQKLPMIDSYQLKTQANSAGYVISQETKYPGAAMKLIELMHSTKAMQILIDTTNLVPLVSEEQMIDFTIEKVHQQEKMIAMNYAMQKNLLALNQLSDVSATEVLENEAIRKVIVQYIKDEIELDQVIESCEEIKNEWLAKQIKEE